MPTGGASPARCWIASTYTSRPCPWSNDDLASEQGGESSADVRARVMAARALQQARYKALPGVRCNAQLPSGALRRYCRMTPAAEDPAQRV